MKRRQQLLVAVLVLQIVLTVVVFWPRQTVLGGEPVFSELAVDDIVSLTITDDAGKSIALQKVGADWVMPKADGYPVRADMITPVLENLLKLDTSTLVASSPVSQERLQVTEDAFVRRVVFETAEGQGYILYLGSAPRYTATHFRLDGQEETYLTDALSTWDLNTAPSSWVESSYLALDAETLTTVTLENVNGTYTFVKNAVDVWTMAGLVDDEEADPTQIDTLVRQATTIGVNQPLGKTEEEAYGLADPTAVVTLQTEKDTTTVTVGALDPDASAYVIKSSTSPYYVTVSSYGVNAIVEHDRAAFLKAEPTPVPEE